MDFTPFTNIILDKSISSIYKLLWAMAILVAVLFIDQTIGFSKFMFFKRKADVINGMASSLSDTSLPDTVRQNIKRDLVILSGSKPLPWAIIDDNDKSIPALKKIDDFGIGLYCLYMLSPTFLFFLFSLSSFRVGVKDAFESLMWTVLIWVVFSILTTVLYVVVNEWPIWFNLFICFALILLLATALLVNVKLELENMDRDRIDDK